MSRIDEALKRVGARPSADEPVDSFTLQKYALESVSESSVAGGAAPKAALPADKPNQPEVDGITSAPPKSAPGAAVAWPRSGPVLSPQTSTSGSLSAQGLTLNTDPLLLERCRRIAGVLHTRQVQRGLKRAAVTSAVYTEGKAHIAVHLALTLARNYGNRVILIDADSRRPFIHEVIGGPNDAGLSEALGDGHREVPIIQVSPYLHVLTVGRPAPTAPPDLLSARMPALIDDCAGRYDWVLLNAPPTSLLPDAQVLVRLTRGIVFVLGASTSFPIAENAISEIGREFIIGRVLVGFEEHLPTSLTR
jgi:Mrp family chromosome partitioning ATPase